MGALELAKAKQGQHQRLSFFYFRGSVVVWAPLQKRYMASHFRNNGSSFAPDHPQFFTRYPRNGDKQEHAIFTAIAQKPEIPYTFFIV